MKANFPIEAASVEQINKYFLEQQEVTEQMLKILEPRRMQQHLKLWAARNQSRISVKQ